MIRLFSVPKAPQAKNLVVSIGHYGEEPRRWCLVGGNVAIVSVTFLEGILGPFCLFLCFLASVK